MRNTDYGDGPNEREFPWRKVESESIIAYSIK